MADWPLTLYRPVSIFEYTDLYQVIGLPTATGSAGGHDITGRETMTVTDSDRAHLAAEPYRVGEGTYVVPQLMEAPPVGLFYLNSLVIQGSGL